MTPATENVGAMTHTSAASPVVSTEPPLSWATQLAVASINVENLDPTDPPSKFARLAGIVLADPEDLGGSDRSVVARARVARNPFSLPRTLVVKHYLAEAVPDRPDPFHYEVASCQLFTALPADDRSSPVLIA